MTKRVHPSDARMLVGKNVMLFDMDEVYCPLQPGDTVHMDDFEIILYSVKTTEDWGRFTWYCEIGCSRLDALMKFMTFVVDAPVVKVLELPKDWSRPQ